MYNIGDIIVYQNIVGVVVDKEGASCTLAGSDGIRHVLMYKDCTLMLTRTQILREMEEIIINANR